MILAVLVINDIEFDFLEEGEKACKSCNSAVFERAI
jgi:hypothetical protein